MRIAADEHAAALAIEGGALSPELGGRVWIRVVGADGLPASAGVPVRLEGPRWPWLLRRVFAVEVSVCPLEGCSGRMRVVEIAIKPDDVARVLEEQSPERRAPRARAPPPLTASLAQLRFAFS